MDPTATSPCKSVTEDPIRIGIIGCGVAIKHHIPAIRQISGVRVVGLCDLDPLKAQDAAKRFQVQNTYGDLTSLLEEQEPHVIHILTPPATHAAFAITAMERGCHVLVEKPMALSLAEVDAMIAAERRNNVQLSVMHNHLFDPPIVRAREILRQGVIGDLLHIEVKYCLDAPKMHEEHLSDSKHWAHKLPLRIFGEYTPHLIYLSLNFLPEVHSVKVSPKQIKAQMPQAVDGVNVTLTTDNGTGHFTMFTNTAYGHFTMHIYGTKGVLHINMLDLTITVEKEYPFSRPIGNMLGTVAQSLGNLSMTAGNLVKIATGRLKRRPGHRLLIERFYEGLRQGENPPVTAKEGREVVRILEMIKDNWSSQNGSTRSKETLSEEILNLISEVP